jgi:cation diffusion facilitator family transporter
MNSQSPTHTSSSKREQFFAIRLSLGIGFLMLAGKTYAYVITGSNAILSDAAESVVHVFAVGFAVFSMWLSHLPADRDHPYGHEKVAFFSAGMEGTLIVLAALVIIYESVSGWIAGLQLRNLTTGTLFILGASAMNFVLGIYLISRGKYNNSLILVANGYHVLTDSWTSIGVVAGLLLTVWTGWLPFDPLVAIAVALNILWAGGKLIRRSIGGLMDEGNPELHARIRTILDREVHKRGLQYHELRYRISGSSVWVEMHLLLPRNLRLDEAHRFATEIEAAVQDTLTEPVTITTHLEPAEIHDEAHNLQNAGQSS